MEKQNPQLLRPPQIDHLLKVMKRFNSMALSHFNSQAKFPLPQYPSLLCSHFFHLFISQRDVRVSPWTNGSSMHITMNKRKKYWKHVSENTTHLTTQQVKGLAGWLPVLLEASKTEVCPLAKSGYVPPAMMENTTRKELQCNCNACHLQMQSTPSMNPLDRTQLERRDAHPSTNQSTYPLFSCTGSSVAGSGSSAFKGTN